MKTDAFQDSDRKVIGNILTGQPFKDGFRPELHKENGISVHRDDIDELSEENYFGASNLQELIQALEYKYRSTSKKEVNEAEVNLEEVTLSRVSSDPNFTSRRYE